MSGNSNKEENQQFLFNFIGLSAYQPPITAGTEPPQCSLINPVTWTKFVNYQGYNNVGNTTGTGNGDYHHIAGGSPVIGLASNWVLPYDISGQVRGPNSEAGCYATQYGSAGIFGAQ